MPFNFGFVAHAADRKTINLRFNALATLLPTDVFADSWRADQAGNRTGDIPLHLADGSKFENPFLNIIEAVVVAVEYFAGAIQIA